MANIIFDFDGTIADTLDIGISAFRQVSKKGRSLTPAKIEELRGLSALQAMKTLNIHWWQLPYLIYKMRKELDERMTTGRIHPFEGIEAALEALKKKGYRLFIVSTNSNKNIVYFLKGNKLEGYFEKVYGGSGIFSKAATLQKVVLASRLKMNQCVYVGDEVRDIEAAKKAGMRCLSVTWGYNNRKALETAGAKILADNPRDLPKFLIRLMNGI